MTYLADAQATQAFGARLAHALQTHARGLVMALEGELGAGKTALARATIMALGHDGVVVSPTYTLLESYAVGGRQMHHLDLYRLADPEELEFVGLRELDAQHDWFMIEWPERGVGHVPRIDVSVTLAYAGSARTVALQAHTAAGTAFSGVVDKQR